MRYKVLTYNNGVGIVTDAELLVSLIRNITHDVKMEFIDKITHEQYDVGIWIQNFDINLLNLFKKNIFFINEEWSGNHELNNLHLFDYVVCKTKHAKELLSGYKDTICLPFISKNYYLDINRDHRYVHFAGRSIQKNTELILKQNASFTLIDPYSMHMCPNHFTHINTYQSEDRLKILLNQHNIHVCTSLYESWGHYLYEGLSTGNEIICSDIPAFNESLDPNLVHFIPTTVKFDFSYAFDRETIQNGYPLRKSYHIDQSMLRNIIENFEPIGKNKERCKLFDDIIKRNSDKLIEFFLNI